MLGGGVGPVERGTAWRRVEGKGKGRFSKEYIKTKGKKRKEKKKREGGKDKKTCSL